MSAAAAAPPVDGPRWRYPGAQSFTESDDDQARFFGRDTEADDLYLRVLSVPMVVHFGRSGLGKTSLLQAGLFPRLRRKPLLPVMVRLNQADEPLHLAVARGLRQACAVEQLPLRLDERAEGLWELLQATTLWRGDLLLTPVLVFDQLEEIFTLRGEAFRQALVDELAALLSGKPPRRLPPPAPGERLVRPAVKLVLSLREDYLGALQQYSATLPGLFHELVRLEPMAADAAAAAITGPAQRTVDAHGQPYTVPPFGFDPQALAAMVDYLQGQSGVIEPFQLQLLCRHAEQRAAGHLATDGQPVLLRPADFSGANDFATVLRDFYRGCIARLPRAQRGPAGRLCEEGLLDAEGHRLMLDEGQIERSYRVSDATLSSLEQDRLLRRERRLESVFYEISHDRLAASIRATARFRLPLRLRYSLYTAAVLVPLIVVMLVVWALTLSEARDSAESARNRAERLVSFLLGERFLGEVRDAGLVAQLRQVQDQTADVQEAAERSINRGLALRNAGDLARMRGRSQEASALYAEALGQFRVPALLPAVPPGGAASAVVPAPASAASAPGPALDTAAADDSALVPLREAARTHARLGEVIGEQGNTEQALLHHGQAGRLWVAIDAGGAATSDDCIAWAASLLQQADQLQRRGHDGQALDAVQAAVLKALHVLLGPDAQSPACRTRPSADLWRELRPAPDAAALSVLGQAASAYGRLLGRNDDVDGAQRLGARVRWQQPLSTAARRHELAASTLQATRLATAQPLATLANFRRGLASLDELLRLDPANQLWRRERAAQQVLMADLLADCGREARAGCPGPAEQRQASAIALEALATLRQLVLADADNLGWRLDLAWAWRTYGHALVGRDDASLRAYDEARVLLQPLADAGGPEARLVLARVLAQRSAVVARMGSVGAAIDGYGQAVALLVQLQAPRPDSAALMAELGEALLQQAELQQRAGQVAEASAARVRAERLQAQRLAVLRAKRAAEEDLVSSDGQAFLDHLDRQLQMGRSALVAQQAAAAQGRWRQFVARRPGDATGYRWLMDCAWLQFQALGNLPRDTPEASRRRWLAGAAAMHAGDIARTLADGRAGQGRLAQLRADLSGVLNDDGRGDDALALAQQAVVDAQQLLEAAPGAAPAATADPLADRLGLRNALLQLAVLRRSQQEEGWEEAVLSALEQTEQALVLSPTDRAARLGLAELLVFRIGAHLADGQAELAARERPAAVQAVAQARQALAGGSTPLLVRAADDEQLNSFEQQLDRVPAR